MPEFFIEMLKEQYSEEEIEKIILGLNKKKKVTLRVNTLKSNVEKIKKELDKANIIYKEFNKIENALIIENVTEKQLEEMEIYEKGEIYLQSLSSMLPPIIMEPKQNEDILDMCAAPGGKTTQIAAITENKAHITACELNSIRAERLKYNIEKQGANGSVYVMPKDARTIDDFFSFDRILLDAPCSGSGTLILDNDKTFKYFTPALIEKSSKTQIKLLKKAINILKPGKEMVYSTCSVLKKENEDIIQSILKTGKVEIVPIQNNIISELPLLKSKIDGTLCICPNEIFEGFFIARLRKKF